MEEGRSTYFYSLSIKIGRISNRLVYFGQCTLNNGSEQAVVQHSGTLSGTIIYLETYQYFMITEYLK